MSHTPEMSSGKSICTDRLRHEQTVYMPTAEPRSGKMTCALQAKSCPVLKGQTEIYQTIIHYTISIMINYHKLHVTQHQANSIEKRSQKKSQCAERERRARDGASATSQQIARPREQHAERQGAHDNDANVAQYMNFHHPHPSIFHVD